LPFAELCFTDPSGRVLQQGDVHRELQTFLSNHRRAWSSCRAITARACKCARLLWELGTTRRLRQVVCATEAIAAERCRFLRYRGVEPTTAACLSGTAAGDAVGRTRFTVRRPAEVIGPSVAGWASAAPRPARARSARLR
jgi:hypothetical protein